MSKIKFIYFDIGGVLIRGAHSKDAATLVGLPEEIVRPVFEKYWHDALIGKITAEQFLEFLKKELPIHKSLKNFPKIWVESIQPIHETRAFLHEISKTHRIGFLTNLFTDLFVKLQEHNIVPVVSESVLVGSWEVGLAKPDNAIFALAQEKSRVEPSEILFVDDKVKNVEMAKKLGWQGIVFNPNNPVESIKEIKKLL